MSFCLDADLVLDGSDKFRVALCGVGGGWRAGIAHVWAAILGFDAQLSVFWAGHGPVYEDLVPSCSCSGSVPRVVLLAWWVLWLAWWVLLWLWRPVKLLTGVGSRSWVRVGLYSALAGGGNIIPPLVASVQAWYLRKALFCPRNESCSKLCNNS